MRESEAPESWTTAGGIAIQAEAGIVRRLGRDAIEALARGEHETAVLKANPRRRVALVATSIGAAVVKRYATEHGLERVKAMAFGTRARREWDTASALLAAGLPAPQPWFVASGGSGAYSASFCAAAIERATPLGGFLEARFVPSDARSNAKVDALTPTLRVLARMHAAGLHHRDFHGGNVLVRGDDPNDVVVIDLHRVETGARVRESGRVTALATLLHTLRFALSRPEMAQAIARYAAFANSPHAIARWTRAVLRAIDRRESVRVKSRSKRCVRESSEFTALAVGGCAGWRRRSVAQAALFAAIASARTALAQGLPAVRSIARRSSVALASDAGSPLAIKVYDGDGRKQSLRARLARGRAGTAYRAGFALTVRGVAAPAVVAWLKTPDRAVLVTEALDDAETLLAASFRWLASSPGDARREMRAAGIAVAALLQSMWNARVQVHDLSPKNILLRHETAGMRAYLCDFDGIAFGRAPTAARMIKGLAQVNDVAPGLPARPRLAVLARLRHTLPELARADVVQAIAARTRARAQKQST